MDATARMPDWLSRQATVGPTKTALVFDERAYTYRELLDASLQMKTLLQHSGVHSGDRVAVLSRSSHWFTLAVHGIMQADAVVVPLNRKLQRDELAYQLRDVDATTLLVDESMKEVAEQVLTAAGADARLVEAEHSAFEKPSDPRESLTLDGLHSILYTSGTTGFPKGAMLTNGTQWFSAAASMLTFGMMPDDEWLMPMPLFHVGGLASLMRTAIYGTTAVVHQQFDATRVHDELERRHITMLSVVPTMLQRMLAQMVKPRYETHLRAVLVGGSGVSSRLLQTALERGLPVHASYGLTEANSTTTVLRPTQLGSHIGSSGLPMPAVQVAIRLKDGTVAREPNRIGEILLAGPTIMAGYWRRPEATDQTIVDGWLHTGDIGSIAEDGHLTVLDRRNDLIVVGGENVYPAEVEGVLSACPGVVEAGVFGATHEELGQVPMAVVVLEADRVVLEEDMLQFCRERLAAYKCPRSIAVAEELPRNASGKLLRRKLQECIAPSAV
ncbi:MAG: o-succinylbenzoate--CoA ligase [Alicyclobacillaceae bacterium]|uniref:o-succinylbenzoate--CoA ligase n=1 Tax=Alicyclobacillus sp. SP_1 TaxID=2942475 RepID=UPI0021575E09|nr:o-succinylbenzoate--CoA ligase [Alicyclobacillus sp. SP_1]MCY0895798.1 o-succinylbenzoate--CoA ligase [Alicyclobacillaceae bacterium]